MARGARSILERLIADKSIELTAVEDWHGANPAWTTRDQKLRAQIEVLKQLRDLLPKQRRR